MTRAEEQALKKYPEDKTFTSWQKDTFDAMRDGFIVGYEQATQNILIIVESRISEIIGDAQPKPALRAELQELITKIKEQ